MKVKILVWGLGYVGTISAACFARLGHEVIGIDPNRAKVNAINNGVSLVKEPGIQALVKQTVEAGHLRAPACKEHTTRPKSREGSIDHEDSSSRPPNPPCRAGSSREPGRRPLGASYFDRNRYCASG